MRTDVVNRLKRAHGHLGGVIRMAGDDRACDDLLLQLAAVRAAIDKTAAIILEDYAQECMDSQVGDDEMKPSEALLKAVRAYIVA
jgi:DNA-binding FrmR family transcriptional regulator